MSAPALLMVAHGSTLPGVQRTTRALSQRLTQMRPNLSVHLAFVDHASPTPHEVIDQLVAEDVAEVAAIPLDLSRAVEPDAVTADSLAQVAVDFPDIRVGLSRPIGPATGLLTVLDERVRAALRQTRTTELDALVLSLPRGGDVRGNAVVSRRARQWSNHHHLPVVVGVADSSGPGVAAAISSLRSQGRRHIAVGSMFIAENELFHLQAEAARQAGAIAVSAPIGADDRLLELVMARYSYAAMGLLDLPDLPAEPGDFGEED